MTTTKLRSRGIYLLPNSLTTINLLAGFFVLISVSQQQFAMACIAVVIAFFVDGLDGRVARLTNTQTEFGVQYDSLTDMSTFGMATGFLVTKWSLLELGKIGWLVAFLYVAAVALRLARFNTQAATGDKRYFQGLNCTTAAGTIACGIWLAERVGLDGRTLAPVMLVIMVALSFAMVSNLRYHSMKQIGFMSRVPFMRILLLVLAIVVVALDPPAVLFILGLIYILSGPVLTIIYRRRKKRQRHMQM